jgi:flagellar protein FlaG
MLIQNISGAGTAVGFTGDSGPVPVSAPVTQAAPVASPQAATKQVAQPTEAQLKSAVDSINTSMKQNNTNVEFSLDPNTKQTVIKVTDSETGQVITQFPSKQILAISQMIEQAQNGALLKQQA